MQEFGQDHQAVAVDMRGYNLSSRPAAVNYYEMPELVEDIHALALHLGASEFTLVGHVPNLQIQRIEDGTHWIVHEHGELVNRYIRDFLQQR